ncbi:MAG: hypothetical protein CMM49_06285 [Rhodospirillaceae bacterium]|nr:hypothetical protein [Rhodospirillaceae bacterium]|tara:strand:- start:222 stop:782 length:561 start_codon:yes stop_codon:yes gene_type:complete
MPLSIPLHDRQLLHTRNIEVKGYIRPDNLYEIEGYVKDIRSNIYKNKWIEIHPGQPMHHMQARLAIDENYVVKEIEVASDSHPYPGVCSKVISNFNVLIGCKIGGGWKKTVKEKLGGVKGCTHIVELLLAPLATTAYLTIYLYKNDIAIEDSTEEKKPGFIDSCYALDSTGVVVEKQWSKFAKKKI